MTIFAGKGKSDIWCAVGSFLLVDELGWVAGRLRDESGERDDYNEPVLFFGQGCLVSLWIITF